MKTIHRYAVPVDDQAHDIELSGPIVHVGTKDVRQVDFWALVDVDEPRVRTFQVFGTGHPIPDEAAYLGTAVASIHFVWHLFEIDGAS